MDLHNCYFLLLCFSVQLFFLPGSVVEEEKSVNNSKYEDLKFSNELDIGENIKFEPSKLLAKFQRDAKEFNETVATRKVLGFRYIKPKLALVFGDMSIDPYQIQMVTVATALREIGYEIEVITEQCFGFLNSGHGY